MRSTRIVTNRKSRLARLLAARACPKLGINRRSKLCGGRDLGSIVRAWMTGERTQYQQRRQLNERI